MSESTDTAGKADNIASAQDVKKMLSELKPEAATNDRAESEKAGEKAVKIGNVESSPVNGLKAAQSSTAPGKTEPEAVKAGPSSDTKTDVKSTPVKSEPKSNGTTPEKRENTRDQSHRGSRGRGRGARGSRGNFHNYQYRNNIKSSFNEQEVSDDPQEIRKQVRDSISIEDWLTE